MVSFGREVGNVITSIIKRLQPNASTQSDPIPPSVIFVQVESQSKNGDVGECFRNDESSDGRTKPTCCRPNRRHS